jgi:sugar (pentulose or hexulose) kinase
VDTSARHVVGIDYGTLSGRAVVVRVSDGAELASAVHDYEHAVVDSVLPGTGERLPPDWALQVPSRLFAEYVTIHDYFGRGMNDVMRRLKALRREVRA